MSPTAAWLDAMTAHRTPAYVRGCYWFDLLPVCAVPSTTTTWAGPCSSRSGTAGATTPREYADGESLPTQRHLTGARRAPMCRSGAVA